MINITNLESLVPNAVKAANHQLDKSAELDKHNEFGSMLAKFAEKSGKANVEKTPQPTELKPESKPAGETKLIEASSDETPKTEGAEPTDEELEKNHEKIIADEMMIQTNGSLLNINSELLAKIMASIKATTQESANPTQPIISADAIQGEMTSTIIEETVATTINIKQDFNQVQISGDLVVETATGTEKTLTEQSTPTVISQTTTANKTQDSVQTMPLANQNLNTSENNVETKSTTTVNNTETATTNVSAQNLGETALESAVTEKELPFEILTKTPQQNVSTETSVQAKSIENAYAKPPVVQEIQVPSQPTVKADIQTAETVLQSQTAEVQNNAETNVAPQIVAETDKLDKNQAKTQHVVADTENSADKIPQAVKPVVSENAESPKVANDISVKAKLEPEVSDRAKTQIEISEQNSTEVTESAVKTEPLGKNDVKLQEDVIPEKLENTLKTEKQPQDIAVDEKVDEAMTDQITKVKAETPTKVTTTNGDEIKSQLTNLQGVQEFINAKSQAFESAQVQLPTAEPLPQAPQLPLEKQIALQVIKQLDTDKPEFQMQLFPKDLGKITVKMVMQGGLLVVEMSAANPKTQSLLLANSDEIKSILQMQSGNHSEVFVDSSERPQPQQQTPEQHQNKRGQQEPKDEQVQDDYQETFTSDFLSAMNFLKDKIK